MDYVQIYQSDISIGGQQIPSFGFTVDVGTYGQIGRSSIHTTPTVMRNAGLGINDLQGNVQIIVNGRLIFGGIYLDAEFIWHENEIILNCRDFSSVLFDSKRSLASLNYENQTVSQLVQSICDTYNLQAHIQITNDPQVGLVFNASGITGGAGTGNGGSSMSSYPQTMWNLIVALARQTGAQVFTTPQGVLNFIDRNANQQANQYEWFGPPVDYLQNTNATNPILRLSTLHQPNLNKNFVVIVKSHHRQTVQDIVSTVTVAGEDIPVTGTKKTTIPVGTYTASRGAQVHSVLAAGGLGLPVFEYRKDGLTADEVQAACEGKAREIAKRLLVWNATVDANMALLPNQMFQIMDASNLLLGMGNIPLFIAGVKHHYGIPQDDSVGSDGFLTTVKLLTLPPAINPQTADDFATIIGGN